MVPTFSCSFVRPNEGANRAADIQAQADTEYKKYNYNNAAFCLARLNRIDDAFTWLRKSVVAGWRDVEHLETDPDLEALHADARWPAVVDEAAFA